MGRVIGAVGHLIRREEGQDLIEYGLLMMLIAIGAMVAVNTLGTTINAVLWEPIVQNF